MTNDNAAGRRRMGAYQPQADGVGNSVAAAPTVESVAPVETPPAAPARKTRMGASTPAPEPTVSQPTQDQAPTARRRMGASSAPAAPTAPAPAGRQRMGSPATPGQSSPTRMGDGASEPAVPAAEQQPAASTGGTRMGAPQASATVAEKPAPATPETPEKPQDERPTWVRPALIIAGLVVLGLVVVLGARWLRTLEPIQEFIATYDGHSSQPDTAPAGFPAWMGWQHFFNMFFIVLIIRTGLQVRYERKPPAQWTAKKNSFFSPRGAMPKKVSLTQWLHQSLDVLWIVNGIVFVVLLVVTDHWMRIVPTSWDVFPNMLSGAIQYASLDWPTENGWLHYNALQVMAYFVTVFIAAPLAVISGLRISTWWPDQNQRLNKLYPVEVARAIHFPVMLYFVLFTITHVFLVFFTGALRNLNHMYTNRDVVDWWGLVIFLGSVVVIAAAWFLTKPIFTRPIADKMGKVSK